MNASDRDLESADRGEELPAMSRPHEILASLQDLTGIGVWLHDTAAGRTWWSEQAKGLCGISADQGPSFVDAIGEYTDAEESEIADAFTKTVEDERPFSVDVKITRDGTTGRIIRIRCKPNTIDGDVVALHGTVQDITDVVRKEQRIEVLRETSQRLKDADSQQDVAGIMADASKNILGLVNTTVRLVDGSDSMLRTVVATEECVQRAGERPDYSVSEATPAARTFRSGEPELHPDHEATEDDFDRGELQSGLYVPIGKHGVLSAGDIVLNAFDERDLEAASLLGQLGAEAITRIGLAKRSRAI